MTVFKCKMCGGTIEFEEGASVGVCDYCGTKQTLPRLDDDRRANLYDRANHFRRNNEYDKAMGIYEQILSEDPYDAEAYWSLVLCRYGIEYVEDPATHKRVPTVNRAQFTSIFDDDNYKSAIQYADALQKDIYEEEAKTINEIQKGILAISQKEEPYDVFICYKETDNNGRRTPDSVIANDLYHQLTQEGFKTFFSRITLEDKLGTAYEPYIFAALNSAKVMVALGTKPEHFNAVWVKNEWSRFLSLVKQSGGKKMLIPAYRDMDPYDLPEEFSHLQAQDMSKLGFMQDLIRGIKKIVGKDEPQPAVRETVVMPGGGNMNLNAQLKRGHQALEDHEWQVADSFYDKALDLDAECGEAFMGKALAELELVSLDQLVESRLNIPVTDTQRLQACGRNTRVEAEAAEKYRVTGYFERSNIVDLFPDAKYYESKTAAWQKRIEEESAFWESNRLLSRAQRYASGDFAVRLKDARNKIDSGLQKQLSISQDNDERKKAELIEASAKETDAALQRADERYKASCEARESAYQMHCARQSSAASLNDFLSVKEDFLRPGIRNYKDSEQRAAQCQREIDQLEAEAKAKEEAEQELQRQEEEKQRLIREQEEEKQRLIKEKAAKEAARKRKKVASIAAPILIACIALAIILTTVIIPNQKMDKAMSLLDSGDYEAAYSILDELGKNDAIESNKYDRAMALIESGDYDNAYVLLEEIGKTDVINSNKYDRAMDLIDSGEYKEAYVLLEEAGKYDAIESNKYDRAMALIESGDYDNAYALLEGTGKAMVIKSNKYQRAIAFIDSGDYDNAIALLKGLDLNDSEAQLEKCYIAKYGEAFWNSIKNVTVGDTIVFGSYEQDNDSSNGKEAVEWIVLKKKGSSLFLLSKYGIDYQPYNTSGEGVTWENCSLREWLNGSFLNNAFSADEQDLIQVTNVIAKPNPEYDTDPGSNTNDKVFLLSISEFTEYFSDHDDNSLLGIPTQYAIAQGCTPFEDYADYRHMGVAFALWRLRTPGENNEFAACVRSNVSGVVNAFVGASALVRPALWISL